MAGTVPGVRVLLVNSHGGDRSYGGAERYLDVLRTELERTGVACSVLSAFPQRDGRSDALGVLHATDWREDEHQRIAGHIGAWLPLPGARLTAALRAAAPDVVHTHNLFGITTGIWESARRLGLPVVHTLHDYGLLCPRTTLRRADGSSCRPHPLLCGLRQRQLNRWSPAVTAVVGVSAHVLWRHQALFPARTARHVIRAPFTRASAPAQAACGRPGHRLRVLGFIGRLDECKGISALLAAAADLARDGVTVRIAGDGPLSDVVAACPEVEYLGRLNRWSVPAFVRSCDAGVVPSEWEEPGVTFAALEWLAGGRPVLVAAVGGLRELPTAGVVQIGPGSAGITTGVRESRDGAAWAALCAGAARVGSTSGSSDTDRFANQHLRVYTEAIRSTP